MTRSREGLPRRAAAEAADPRKPAGGPAGGVVRCAWGHRMAFLGSAMRPRGEPPVYAQWSCDACGEDKDPTRSGRHHCRDCEYDLCQRCRDLTLRAQSQDDETAAKAAHADGSTPSSSSSRAAPAAVRRDKPARAVLVDNSLPLHEGHEVLPGSSEEDEGPAPRTRAMALNRTRAVALLAPRPHERDTDSRKAPSKGRSDGATPFRQAKSGRGVGAHRIKKVSATRLRQPWATVQKTPKHRAPELDTDMKKRTPKVSSVAEPKFLMHDAVVASIGVNRDKNYKKRPPDEWWAEARGDCWGIAAVLLCGEANHPARMGTAFQQAKGRDIVRRAREPITHADSSASSPRGGPAAVVVAAVPEPFYPSDITDGSVLTCKKHVKVFKSVQSWIAIDEIPAGTKVVAAGEPRNSFGYQMVPLRPVGAIELKFLQIPPLKKGLADQAPAPPAAAPRKIIGVYDTDRLKVEDLVQDALRHPLKIAGDFTDRGVERRLSSPSPTGRHGASPLALKRARAAGDAGGADAFSSRKSARPTHSGGAVGASLGEAKPRTRTAAAQQRELEEPQPDL